MGNGYIGVDNTSRKIENIYVGVDGVARSVKKAYVGDGNGVARLIFDCEILTGDFLTANFSITSLYYVSGSTIDGISATSENDLVSTEIDIGTKNGEFSAFRGRCLLRFKDKILIGGEYNYDDYSTRYSAIQYALTESDINNANNWNFVDLDFDFDEFIVKRFATNGDICLAFLDEKITATGNPVALPTVIHKSTDGINWTKLAVNLPAYHSWTTGQWHNVCYANGMFYYITPFMIMCSSDGEEWSEAIFDGLPIADFDSSSTAVYDILYHKGYYYVTTTVRNDDDFSTGYYSTNSTKIYRGKDLNHMEEVFVAQVYNGTTVTSDTVNPIHGLIQKTHSMKLQVIGKYIFAGEYLYSKDGITWKTVNVPWDNENHRFSDSFLETIPKYNVDSVNSPDRAGNIIYSNGKYYIFTASEVDLINSESGEMKYYLNVIIGVDEAGLESNNQSDYQCYYAYRGNTRHQIFLAV